MNYDQKAAAIHLRGLAQQIEGGKVSLADLAREAGCLHDAILPGLPAGWLAKVQQQLPDALRARAEQLDPLS